MIETLEAVYEDGVFKPLEPTTVSEGQHVRLVIEPLARLAPDDMLALAAQVFEGLSEEQVEAVRQVALERREFFGREDE